MRRLVTLAAAVFVFITLGTQTASAATVNWKPLSGTNSSWHCGGWYIHDIQMPPLENLQFQGCVVTNSTGGAQAVLRISNNTASSQWIQGEINFQYTRGDVLCAESNFASTGQAMCMGPTVQVGCGKTTTSPNIGFAVLNSGGNGWIYDWVKVPGVKLC